MPRKQAAAATAAGPQGSSGRRDEPDEAPALCDLAACGKPLDAILWCSRCKEAMYCSKECQTKAWKAGHKRECTPAPQAAPRAAAAAAAVASRRAAASAARRAVQAAAFPTNTMTAEQSRLLSRLADLEAARDWKAILALESEALALAHAVRVTRPDVPGPIHSTLGRAYERQSQFVRAIELHERDRDISHEHEDRAGVARACSNIGVRVCRERECVYVCVCTHTCICTYVCMCL